MATPSTAALSRICLEPGASPHVFDASSEPLEFVTESLRKRAVISDDDSLRGTRSRASERTRPSVYTVGGEIVLHPSPADLDRLLPRILGAAESSDTFALAESLPSFGVLVDRVAETFACADCKVNKATFRGRPGRPVVLVLEIVGKTETTGTSFPAVTPGATAAHQPYSFSEGELTLLSAPRQVQSFELVIDNAIKARFVNSLSAVSLVPQDRRVTLKAACPFTADETDLYGQPAAGAAATLVFTSGNMSTTFSFAALQTPDLSPVADKQGEITLTLEMTARSAGATKELVVTHDSTP